MHFQFSGGMNAVYVLVTTQAGQNSGSYRDFGVEEIIFPDLEIS